MLHGLRAWASYWDGVAQEFRGRYHILALDQRGRGESDWAPDGDYSYDAYVSDLEQMVDKLGLDNIILLGHSMGGVNTILYTSRHPKKVAKAIIEDVGPMTPQGPSGRARIVDELKATPLEFSSRADAASFLRKERPRMSDAALKVRMENTLKELPSGAVTWKFDLNGIWNSRVDWNFPDLWPHVRELQCPTLVLRGGLSDILSPETAEGMAQANSNIRWVEVPDAAHLIHEDNLQVFNREISQFLSAG